MTLIVRILQFGGSNNFNQKCLLLWYVYFFQTKVRLDFITQREYVFISAPILIKTFLASNKKSTDAQGFVKLQWFGD